MAENLNNAFAVLDELLQQTKLDDVTSESTGFDELPDGYFKVEVKKSLLKINNSGNPMAAFQLQITQDGINVIFDEDDVKMETLKGTKGRYVFKNYTFKEQKDVKKFVSDMKKFEGDVPGEPILPEETWTNSETIEEALPCLEGLNIWIQKTSSKKSDGTVGEWISLVSWKRVDELELDK